MKYLSFLIPGCFLFCVTPLFAQNTTTWFPPGAKWSYLVEHFAPASHGEEYLELVGHEVIGGELCAKVHDYGIDDFWGFFLPFDYGFKYFFARNDSVFLWHNNSFKLLYDFNRISGDTFPIPMGIYNHGLVQSTGDTLWNGICCEVFALGETFGAPGILYGMASRFGIRI